MTWGKRLPSLSPLWELLPVCQVGTRIRRTSQGFSVKKANDALPGEKLAYGRRLVSSSDHYVALW